MIYLLGIDREVSHLEDEVGPDDVEDEEDGEEAVEDVVGREHLHQLGSLHCSAEVQEDHLVISNKTGCHSTQKTKNDNLNKFSIYGRCSLSKERISQNILKSMNLEERLAAEAKDEVEDDYGEAGPEDDPGGEKAKPGCHPTERIKYH